MKALIMLGAIAAGLAGGADARTLTVCPEGKSASCRYKGNGGIQAAIDAARDGDVIRIMPGVYHPASFRDVPFSDLIEDLTLRGYIVVHKKRLTIVGEDGAVLDGGDGPPTSAFIIDNADVAIDNLVIRNFRYTDGEDKIYDGHGIFAVNSRVRLDGVTLERIAKMSLTGRGSSQLDARRLCVRDGHIGFWLHEGAYLNLRDSVVSRNHNSGLAAYDFSVAQVSNSLFDTNVDDALYTEHEATIGFTNGVLANNAPFAARALNASAIRISYSVLAGNAGDTATKDKAIAELGPDAVSLGKSTTSDPRFASVLSGKDNPHLRKFGLASAIGPSEQLRQRCD